MLDFITVNTHSSIRIADEKIIYIDPFKITDEPHDADIILITHDHFDHYSPEDILRTCPHRDSCTSFRQILPVTALRQHRTKTA